VDGHRLGSLVRAVRIRKRLRQQDVAVAAGVSRATVTRLEAGSIGRLSLDTVQRIAAVVEVRTELVGRWRGGDGDRLLNWRHSLLADSFSEAVHARDGWTVNPEVSFAVYAERGVIDQLCWHEATRHLLVVELKTEFVDINEMLGTLDRKLRHAPRVAAGKGMRPKLLSAWVIVTDTRTNRRHAARHASLLRAKFPLDGRSLASFLDNPAAATFGLAFWTNAHPENATKEGTRILTRVRAQQPAEQPESGAPDSRATPIERGPERDTPSKGRRR
jgi:transcriptional regulator with XRE-family HTH domain